MSTIHKLKTRPVFFAAIADGSKTFEIRKNDRGFKVGDALVLQCYDPDSKTYNGQQYDSISSFR